MNNEIVAAKITSLEEAIKKATEVAGKLLRCAESISNPQYVVTMEGQQLEILAAAHTAGVITLRVKSPFDSVERQRRYLRAKEAVEEFKQLGRQGTLDKYKDGV